jgi:predicted permease
MRTFFQDLRFGMRVLRSSPGFTVVAVLTLALGIAANTTVFSWIDAVLVRPVPGASDGGRLAALETVTPSGAFVTTSYRDYRDYRDGLKLVSGLAGSLMNAFNVGGDDDARRIWGEFVSGNYFAVLGVRPFLGRVFLPEEYGDKPAAYPVAVISYRLWQKLYGADPGVVGRTVRVNRHELTIVGVAPPEFWGTVPGLALEIWVPFVMAPELNGQGEWLLNSRIERQLWVTARLKPGVSTEQARAEAVILARQIARTDPRASEGFSATVLPVWKSHFGAQALLLKPLQILMAVCFVLFLIVGANVANLQLARATARRKEFSVRLALGASPARLGRQVLTESLLLASIGAVIGLTLALWMVQGLTYLVPPVGVPIRFESRLNGDILGFTTLLCVLGAVVSGLAPALHSVRTNLNDNLKETGRTATSGAGLHRIRSLLVISEVALALVALVGTGLFAMSFQNARTIPLGFDARNVLLSQFYVATFCRTNQQRTQFCLRLHDRLESLPGIEGVSYSNYIPLGFGTSPVSRIEVEGYLPGRSEDMRVYECNIAPGYFKVLRIPLLDGRDFSEQDDRQTAPVAIVNQAFARRFFAGRNPIGRKLRRGDRWFTVVGLAGDSKYHHPAEAPLPYFYVPFRQAHGGEFWMAFYIRTNGPPGQAVAAVRREAAALDPNAAAVETVPLEQYIGASMFPQWVAASLLSVLGGISLLLAAVGLYSVMAYAVIQRSHEFGIRMALGARPGAVLGMVLRQGLALTAGGILAGAVAALAAARLVSSMLVNVSAGDPVIFAAAAVFLGLVAMLASYLPAWRATKVEPSVALRCQ